MKKLKLPKFKSKKVKRNEDLLEQYNKGAILQIDNNINNKEYLKSKQEK